MAGKAYVLIQTEVGSAEAVASALRGITGVVDADIITGPHDVIAVIQGADTDAVARTVMNQVHAVKGVSNTTTYIVVSSTDLES